MSYAHTFSIYRKYNLLFTRLPQIHDEIVSITCVKNGTFHKNPLAYKLKISMQDLKTPILIDLKASFFHLYCA